MKMTALRGAEIAGIDGRIGTLDDLYIESRAWTVRYLVVSTDASFGGATLPLLAQRIAPARGAGAAICMALSREDLRRSAALPAAAAREAWLFSARSLLGYGVATARGLRGRVSDIMVDTPRWLLAGLLVEIDGSPRLAPALVAPRDIEQIDQSLRMLRARLR